MPEVHLLVTDSYGITSAVFVGSYPVSSGAGISDYTLPLPPGERRVVEEDLPGASHEICHKSSGYIWISFGSNLFIYVMAVV